MHGMHIHACTCTLCKHMHCARNGVVCGAVCCASTFCLPRPRQTELVSRVFAVHCCLPLLLAGRDSRSVLDFTARQHRLLTAAAMCYCMLPFLSIKNHQHHTCVQGLYIRQGCCHPAWGAAVGSSVGPPVRLCVWLFTQIYHSYGPAPLGDPCLSVR